MLFKERSQSFTIAHSIRLDSLPDFSRAFAPGLGFSRAFLLLFLLLSLPQPLLLLLLLLVVVEITAVVFTHLTISLRARRSPSLRGERW